MKETQFTPQDEVRHEIPAQHQKKPKFLSRKPLKKTRKIKHQNTQVFVGINQEKNGFHV